MWSGGLHAGLQSWIPKVRGSNHVDHQIGGQRVDSALNEYTGFFNSVEGAAQGRGLAIRPNESRDHENTRLLTSCNPSAGFIWQTSLAVGALPCLIKIMI